MSFLTQLDPPSLGYGALAASLLWGVLLLLWHRHMGSMTHRIVVKRGRDGRWRYLLEDSTGHVDALSTGDGWNTEAEALAEARKLQRNIL